MKTIAGTGWVIALSVAVGLFVATILSIGCGRDEEVTKLEDVRFKHWTPEDESEAVAALSSADLEKRGYAVEWLWYNKYSEGDADYLNTGLGLLLDQARTDYIPSLIYALQKWKAVFESDVHRAQVTEEINSEITKEVILASRSDYGPVRIFAADTLAAIGTSEVIETLSDLIDDDEQFVRIRAVKNLGEVAPDDETVRSLIVSTLSDSSPRVRRAALETLAEIGAPEALKFAEAMRYDEARTVRILAERIISEAHDN